MYNDNYFEFTFVDTVDVARVYLTLKPGLEGEFTISLYDEAGNLRGPPVVSSVFVNATKVRFYIINYAPQNLL